VTLAEVLKGAGYGTAMSGKWHVTGDYADPHNWPCQRGFDTYYGMLCGAGSFWDPHHMKRDNEDTRLEPGQYFTDTIGDEAVAQLQRHHEANPDEPFFQYVAYTAPHWPLHAPQEDIDRYRGRFAKGWDALREERKIRMQEMGILDDTWPISDRDPEAPAWEDAEHPEWEQRRMEAYAAQIDRMDQSIGRILQAYEQTGRMENTLVIFLADNGGCAEGIPSDGEKIWGHGRNSGREFTRDGSKKVRFGNDPSIVPGAEDTYCSYGRSWANLSNTPFRMFKCWTHEGGISTPFIVHWPCGLRDTGTLRHQPAQLPDVMATLVEVSGASYPAERHGVPVVPCEGASLMPVLQDNVPRDRDLFWEHQGNSAVRRGCWKLVRDYPGPWELYNVETDRAETQDLAADHPGVVRKLEDAWNGWARRVGVRDWHWLLERRKALREGRDVPAAGEEGLPASAD
jgi:arylsulfatase